MSIEVFGTLVTALITDLTTELQEADDDFNATLLESKVKAAVMDVYSARKYPATYPYDLMLEEMDGFYSSIRAIALYDYNRIGMEGETHRVENGINRTYEARNNLFADILPVARF